MLDQLLYKSIDQNSKLESLLKKAKSSINSAGKVDDGDRKWFCYIDKFDFQEKSNKVQDINFNLSGDADFVARRLLLALRINRSIVNNGPADAGSIFRPAMFAHDTTFRGLRVDCQVELTESYEEAGQTLRRRYQDQPLPVTLTYSHNNPVFGCPSSYHLDVDWILKRNTVLQCKVTVLSAVNEFTPDADIDQYRIIGMLEGHRIMRAFK